MQANAATHYWTPARMTGATEAPEFPAYLDLVGEIAARLPRRAHGAGADQRTRSAPARRRTRARCARRCSPKRARAAPGLTLVASGGCGSLIQGLADFDPADVARFAPLLYTFHFYEPYLFTHQGAPWMGERLYHTLTGVPWPGDRGHLRGDDARRRGRALAADAR